MEKGNYKETPSGRCIYRYLKERKKKKGYTLKKKRFPKGFFQALHITFLGVPKKKKIK